MGRVWLNIDRAVLLPVWRQVLGWRRFFVLAWWRLFLGIRPRRRQPGACEEMTGPIIARNGNRKGKDDDR